MDKFIGYLAASCLLILSQVANCNADETAATQASGDQARNDQAVRDQVETLDSVLVTGEQTGPSLWKVRKDDHVLWILGALSPLPKKLRWRSQEVETVIANSQEYIANPNVTADIGFFRGLTLLPSLIGVRDNPSGELKDVLPPDLYARWQVLKAKYIGRSNSVEEWRPIFAAQELYKEALGASGLVSSQEVQEKVAKLAKKDDLKITRPTIEMKIDKPRAAIKTFKKTSLDDVNCFEKTVERLETDLDIMRARANAWARGDVAALRQMTYVDQVSACLDAVMHSALVQERGYDTLPGQLNEAWMEAAEAALERNQSTITVVWISELVKPDGYLAKLRNKGYVIEEP